MLSPDAVESSGFVTSKGKFMPTRYGSIADFIATEKPLVAAAQRAWARFSKRGVRTVRKARKKTARKSTRAKSRA